MGWGGVVCIYETARHLGGETLIGDRFGDRSFFEQRAQNDKYACGLPQGSTRVDVILVRACRYIYYYMYLHRYMYFS